MIRPALAAIAFVALSSPVHGQAALGAARAPGITFQVPATPPPSAAPSPGRRLPAQPPRTGPTDRAPHLAPRPDRDLFLAHPGTYAPHFAPNTRKHRLASVWFPPFYAYPLPAPVSVVPYFDEPLAADVVANERVRHGTSLRNADGVRAPGYLKLEVQPATARVFVDRVLAGTVADLTEALPLSAGLHHIELEADGFESVGFDVRVRSNERVRYAGRLVRPRADGERDAAPAAAPVAAKTLYVIPRCYAGDRRPQLADLPADCRLENLRVIAAGR